MNETILFSTVSQEFGDVRLRLASFGQRTHKLDIRHQDGFVNRGVVTLRMLEEEVCQSDHVVHLIGQQAGWVPPQDQVQDFLARHPGFQAKFPDIAADALQGLISATQWEAWLGLYFDKADSGQLRRVFSYEVPEALTEPRQQIHSQRLAACGKFPKKLAAGEQFFDEIVLSLIEQKILAEADFTPRISSRALTRHTAEQFFGRKEVLSYLDEKFADGTNVLSIIAWGGVGKTSLLVHWVETRFVDHDWKQPSGLPLVDAFLEWSFYALGTGALDDDSKVRSGGVGTFFQRAFEFFGDPDYVSADKGTRLAKHIQARRTLLILDGLEPLQHPPGHIQAGQILDPDLRDLIEQLAAYNPGLCLITSREHLKDLEGRTGPKTTSRELEDLDETAAVELLRSMQLKGSDNELAQAAQEYKHHALSLTLIGRFLCDAHEGDIRKRDRIGDIEEADDLTRPERHRTVWRIMASYHAWLQLAGPAEKSRCLNILRLTGLFDSAISADCQEFLRQTPITGITDAIQGMKNPVWNQELKRLERNKLLKLLPDREGGSKIEVHPLIRAYFAKQLQRDQPEAFREAHSRLFDYLCKNTPHRPDGIDGLAPLYEAVTHGCLAGRHREACDKVYIYRILRGMGNDGFYSSKKIGAIGANLAAVAAFFDEPWSQVSPNLTAADQAWLLSEAALRLRALGRLTEALQPMRAGLEMAVLQKDWANAAIRASNLSELELTLGRLPDAVTDARRSITYADQSGDAFLRMMTRTTAADALHQSGQRNEAGDLFAEAERMQKEDQPEFELLYSVRGFQYCDWLLAPAEQAAWQTLRSTGVPPVSADSERDGGSTLESSHGRDAHATGSFHIRRGANLPHWRQDGAIYAVTFRLADSVPKQVLEGWRIEREELVQAAIQKSGQLSAAEADRLQVLFSDKVEAYLNQRQGACWMMRDDVAELVQNALLHFDGSRYDLFAWCVMPNHVHAVVRPRPGHSLESILHSWKSFTSKKISKIVGQTGTIWQAEYYDHLIRDEDDLIHAMEYRLNNPEAAGLKNWRWVGHRRLEENVAVRPVVVDTERSTGVSPVNRGTEGEHGRDIDVGGSHGRDAHGTLLAEVERRAMTTLGWGKQFGFLLDIALDHLTLARVGLIRAILANPLPQPTLNLPHVAAAVNGLRAAGTKYMLPHGLLTAALYRFVRGEYDLAEKDLAEAQQIAERGPMPLYLADIHLTRARFAGMTQGAWGRGKIDAKAELARAAKLIRELGYGRRFEELADAESGLEVRG